MSARPAVPPAKSNAVETHCPVSLHRREALAGNDGIEDISFVIVARNEEFGIRRCLQAIDAMEVKDCEFICVDSNSSDATRKLMSEFAACRTTARVFRCSGDVNSAVARNVGIRHAGKSYVFFIDGDVEPNEAFIKAGLQKLKHGAADAIVGQLREVYYSDDYAAPLRCVEDRYHYRHAAATSYAGGIFLAKKAILAEAGYFDERMVRNQDIDYTLRISRVGRLLAVPMVMGTHHTLEYRERSLLYFRRLYPMFFGMVVRKNLDRPFVLWRLLASQRGLIPGFLVYFLLFLAALATPFSLKIAGLLGATAVVAISADMLRGRSLCSSLFPRFVVHYLNPALVLAGLVVDGKSDAPPVTVQLVASGTAERHAICEDVTQ